MTHDPHRLATAEQIMNGNNPFEKVDTPLGTMERWRAEALIIGTTSGILDVYRTIRDDAASQAARADAEQAREALIEHVCEQITELAKRFDALEARLNEAKDKRRADEAAQRKLDEEEIELPPDLHEYQASEPPAKIGNDTHQPQPGGELQAVKEDDALADLPEELRDLPDTPEPKGSVLSPPTALFGVEDNP